MTIKKDLADIGKYLITPFPATEKYRFPGVDYKRASRNLTVGALVLQVTLVVGVLYGPKIVDKLDDAKRSLTRRYYAHKK